MPSCFAGRIGFVDASIGEDLVKDVKQLMLQDFINVLLANVWVLCLQLLSPWQVDLGDLIVLAQQVFLNLAQFVL